jgi:hypothetical protein
MNRRDFLRKAGIGAAAAVGAPAAMALGASPVAATLETGPDAVGMTNMGVGMYVDMSTAFQMSTFTCTPTLISCGVGTFGQTLLGKVAQSGPFAMLMYSLRIDTYNVDHTAHQITSTGRMRSITRIAGATVEDVEHDYLAVATDTRGVGSPDRWDLNFLTPFWTPGTNPLATPSTEHPGWSRFGGTIVTDLAGAQMGGITVS